MRPKTSGNSWSGYAIHFPLNPKKPHRAGFILALKSHIAPSLSDSHMLLLSHSLLLECSFSISIISKLRERNSKKKDRRRTRRPTSFIRLASLLSAELSFAQRPSTKPQLTFPSYRNIMIVTKGLSLKHPRRLLSPLHRRPHHRRQAQAAHSLPLSEKELSVLSLNQSKKAQFSTPWTNPNRRVQLTFLPLTLRLQEGD